MPFKIHHPLSFSHPFRRGSANRLREFSPPYAHRRAAGSKSSASAALLDQRPEVVIFTVRV